MQPLVLDLAESELNVSMLQNFITDSEKMQLPILSGLDELGLTINPTMRLNVIYLRLCSPLPPTSVA
jgi:hypothetical protein